MKMKGNCCEPKCPSNQIPNLDQFMAGYNDGFLRKPWVNPDIEQADSCSNTPCYACGYLWGDTNRDREMGLNAPGFRLNESDNPKFVPLSALNRVESKLIEQRVGKSGKLPPLEHTEFNARDIDTASDMLTYPT